MQENKQIKIMAVAMSLLLSTATVFAQDNANTEIEVKKTKKKSKKAKTQKHTYSANAKTGFGYDDNPFLTPSNTYNDNTNSGGGALVTPVKKSGIFIPLSVSSDYEYRYKKDIRILADAKLSGKYFANKDLKNANDYKVVASTGIRYRLNKYKREINRIDFNVFAGHVHEIYVDRDDGALKTTGSGDQSNRYQHSKRGAELKYKYDFKKIGFAAKASYETKDYATPASWSELDHTYTRLKFKGNYKFSKKLEAGAHYEFKYADYKFRKVYDINATTGDIKLINPGMNLTYNDIKLFASYKFNKTYKVNLDYLASNRTDNHIGYSDLLTHRISLDNKFKIMKGLRTSLKLKYSIYDYKKAYAYDTSTTLPKKEASTYQVNIDTKYRISSDLYAGLDLQFKKATSTDKRYEYDNTIALANVKYKF